MAFKHKVYENKTPHAVGGFFFYSYLSDCTGFAIAAFTV